MYAYMSDAYTRGPIATLAYTYILIGGLNSAPNEAGNRAARLPVRGYADPVIDSRCVTAGYSGMDFSINIEASPIYMPPAITN